MLQTNGPRIPQCPFHPKACTASWAWKLRTENGLLQAGHLRGRGRSPGASAVVGWVAGSLTHAWQGLKVMAPPSRESPDGAGMGASS